MAKPRQKRMQKRFYAYNPPGTAVAAATTQVIPLTIDQDADFMAMYLTFTATTLANWTLQIEDTDSSRTWFRNPIPILGHFDNTARENYMLPAARYLGRQTVVTFTVTNAGGAPDTIFIVMHGYKLVPVKTVSSAALRAIQRRKLARR